ncbi:MAG: ornithine cyclodeaminase family protein [Desulfurococcales archaeon]|jgi:alanine dehydrogenase|nr:ornithine cyclodeaminase family protein [Desulfurococcales archaeon]
MIFINREEVDSIVDPEGLLRDIRDTYLSNHMAFERVSSTIGDTWIGVMRGYLRNLGFLVKIVGVYPRASPRVKGVVVVIDIDTGDVRAIIDGYSLTGWRTACASALAHEIMGGRDIEVLGIIGAGTQARYHLEVFTRLYRIGRIVISSRTQERVHSLSREYGAEILPLEELNRRATTIVAATNSLEPVVRGDLLRTGSIVISVGAPKPVRELDKRVSERAGCALVDTRKGVLEESEDVEGIELVELGEALRGRSCRFREIKLYKSVGTSTLDLAGAYHIIRRKQSSLLKE